MVTKVQLLLLMLLLLVAVSFNCPCSNTSCCSPTVFIGFVVSAAITETTTTTTTATTATTTTTESEAAAAPESAPAPPTTEQQEQQLEEEGQVCTTTSNGNGNGNGNSNSNAAAAECSIGIGGGSGADKDEAATSSSSGNDKNDKNDNNDKDMRRLAIEFLTPRIVTATATTATTAATASDVDGDVDVDIVVDLLKQEHEFYKLLDIELQQTFDDAWWNTRTMWDFVEEINCPSVGENGPLQDTSYNHIPNEQNTFQYFYAAYHHVMEGLKQELEEKEEDAAATATAAAENQQDDDDDDESYIDRNTFIPPKYRHPSVPISGYTVALHPDVEPRIVKGKGRGLIAKKFIPKGTKIWNASNAAEFPNTQTYYEFLRILHQMDYTDWYWRKNKNKNTKNQNQDTKNQDTKNQQQNNFIPRLVCDAVLWSYTARGGYMSELGQQPWTHSNNDAEKDLDGQFYYLICIDFDEGSMINGADRDSDTDDDTTEEESEDYIINVAEKPPDGYKIGTTHYEVSSSSTSTQTTTTTTTVAGTKQENDDNDEETKTTTMEKYHFGCQGSAMYATQDIPEGTELRMDYWDSAVPAGWAYLNLGWW